MVGQFFKKCHNFIEMNNVVVGLLLAAVFIAGNVESKCENPANYPVMSANKYLCAVLYQVTAV